MGSSGFFTFSPYWTVWEGTSVPPLLSKVTVQSVVTMTDTLLSFTAYPAMPSWVETRVLVGASWDTPAVPMTFI